MKTRYQIKICLVDAETKVESGELFSSYSFEENEYSMDVDWVLLKLLGWTDEQIVVSLGHLNIEREID